jgi:hypothetical protein
MHLLLLCFLHRKWRYNSYILIIRFNDSIWLTCLWITLQIYICMLARPSDDGWGNKLFECPSKSLNWQMFEARISSRHVWRNILKHHYTHEYFHTLSILCHASQVRVESFENWYWNSQIVAESSEMLGARSDNIIELMRWIQFWNMLILVWKWFALRCNWSWKSKESLLSEHIFSNRLNRS